MGKVNETGIRISTDGNQKQKGETAPLINNNIQEGIMEPRMGTKDGVSDDLLSTNRNRTGSCGEDSKEMNQDCGDGTSPLVCDMNQDQDGGTSPLLDGNVDKTKPNFGNQEIGGGTSPLLVPDMNQENEGGTSPLVCANGDDRALYDTAANVVRLREDRGDCVVRSGWCQEHDRMARKVTTTKQVWTRSKKTGLYAYRSRKMSVLSCTSGMPTLVGTMGPRDGAGGNTGTKMAGKLSDKYPNSENVQAKIKTSGTKGPVRL